MEILPWQRFGWIIVPKVLVTQELPCSGSVWQLRSNNAKNNLIFEVAHFSYWAAHISKLSIVCSLLQFKSDLPGFKQHPLFGKKKTSWSFCWNHYKLWGWLLWNSTPAPAWERNNSHLSSEKQLDVFFLYCWFLALCVCVFHRRYQHCCNNT